MINRHIFAPNGYTVHGAFMTCPICGHREKAIPKPNPWECPACRAVSPKVTIVYHAVINHNRSNHRILISLPQEKEHLEFHFNRGRTVFQNRDTSHPMDITERAEILEGTKMQTVLQTEKVRQLLHDLFQTQWGPASLPFASNDLSLERLILLCRFIGYPGSFYTDIPFFIGTQKLPRTFRNTAKQIHDAGKGLPGLMDSLDWCTKSVRKALYQKPALLFFHRELSVIYDCMNRNIDHFCSLLAANRADIFEHLAFLHDNPCCKNFISDFIREAGVKRYLKLLCYPDLLSDCAVTYTCLSKDRQEQVKPMFRKRLNPDDFAFRYSLPTKVPAIPDTVIRTPGGGTYSFVNMKSTTDVTRLGVQLHNCLAHLVPPYRLDGGAPIIGIWKGSSLNGTGAVGAIALIDDRTIIDAEGPDGQPFDADVQEAFLLWMQRHGLEESSVYSSPSDEDDSYFCF